MDYIFRGLGKNKRIRIFGIDAKESISSICKKQETLPLTTVAFARFLLAGAVIGSLEKGNVGVTMQINSDGPIKSIFMQASSDGYIRGYVSNPSADLELDENSYSIENVVGNNGILSVTKVNEEGVDFTSDVILAKSDISQDIAYYFFASEQIPTIIDLHVTLDDNGVVNCAKGYLIQLITGYEEDDVVFLENLKLEKIDNLEDNIKTMFPDFEKLEEIKVKDFCDCSKNKFEGGLATLSDFDLKELTSEDNIEVVCQFCKSKYEFSKEDINNVIETRK
jgi:molecular chaperone Hsp33